MQINDQIAYIVRILQVRLKFIFIFEIKMKIICLNKTDKLVLKSL